MIVGMKKTEQTQEIHEKYNQQKLMWGVGLGKRRDTIKKNSEVSGLSYWVNYDAVIQREYSWKSKFGMEDNEFILQKSWCEVPVGHPRVGYSIHVKLLDLCI